MSPTIILLTGAWSTPAMYSPLLNTLQENGFKAISVRYPSTNNARPPNKTVEDDIKEVRRVLESHVVQGEEIILVVHSYGGIVSADACKGLLATDRAHDGKKGGIVHFVYLGAYMVRSGSGVMKVITEAGKLEYASTGMELADDGAMKLKDPRAHYFEGLADAQKDKLVDGLMEWHPASTLSGVVEDEPWTRCKSTYVKTSRDIMIPPEYQAVMLEQASEFIEKGMVKVDELHTGHCPFVEDVPGCMRIISAAAGVSSGRS